MDLHLLQCAHSRSENNLWKSFLFLIISSLGLELRSSVLVMGAFTILPAHVWLILNVSPSTTKSHEWGVGCEVPHGFLSDLLCQGHRFIYPCVSIQAALMRITFQKM